MDYIISQTNLGPGVLQDTLMCLSRAKSSKSLRGYKEILYSPNKFFELPTVLPYNFGLSKDNPTSIGFHRYKPILSLEITHPEGLKALSRANPARVSL